MIKHSTFIKLGKSPSEDEDEQAQVILHSREAASAIPLRTAANIYRLCFPETPFSREESSERISRGRREVGD
jgi:hypothetical protein